MSEYEIAVMDRINGNRGKKYRGRDNRAVRVTYAVLICLLAFMLCPQAVISAPVRTADSWSDTFDSTAGIAGSKDSKVSGGSLKLGEAVPPVDLGVAVPGEKAVYAVLAAAPGNGRIYCGTGEKGHLVEYDPAELYQEGYRGPTHFGVSNSRGQAVASPEQSEVKALLTDGTYIYGGTYPDGHLFRFDPAVGGVPEDLGTCPGAGGAILSLAYDGPTVYGGTADGYLFSYNGAFTGLGQPAGSYPLSALAAVGGTLYIGAGNGRLYSYEGGGPGVFGDLGQVSAAPNNALASSAAVLYIGTGTPDASDGGLYSYDTGSPGPFTNHGQPPDGRAVNALAVSQTVVYAGSQGGRLFKFDGEWSDQGVPANSAGAPINSLSLAADGTLYGGVGSDDAGSIGRLFRLQVVLEDYESPPGGGAISDVVSADRKVLMSTDEGEIFTCSGYDTSTQSWRYDLLQTPIEGTINCMDVYSGVSIGLDDGHVWLYASGTFYDLGAPDSPAPVWSVLSLGDRVYLGMSDGRLLRRDIDIQDPSRPKEFVLKAQLAGGVKDLSLFKPDILTNVVFAATSEGKLYSFQEPGVLGGPWSADSSSLNALAQYDGAVFAGSENNKLYRFDGLSLVEVADCMSPVRSLATANQGVACGTGDGRLYIFDSELRDLGEVPGAPTAVASLAHVNGYIFGGTAAGGLFSRDDAFLGDRGQVVQRQISVYCLEYDPNTHLFYAGTYRNAHFLVIDPLTNRVIDRGRPVNGDREIEDILVASDGTVYGSTYGGTQDIHNPQGGHIFIFNPAPGPGESTFTDVGRAPSDGNWWISSLVEGGGGLIYGATSNSVIDETNTEGRLFSIDPRTLQKTPLGVPVSGEGTRCLTYGGGRIYGGTWKPNVGDQASVYAYEPGGAPTKLGDAPPTPSGEAGQEYVNDLLFVDGTIYGSQHNGYVFSFSSAGGYDPVVLGKPDSDSNAVPILVAGPDNTFICGTINEVNAPLGGHVVSYDPGLREFRQIAALVPAEYPNEHTKIPGLARSSDTGVVIGGTAVRLDTQGESADGARLFRIDPFNSNPGPEGAHAVSTVIAPGLVELSSPVAGHEAVGALCAAPSGGKQIVGGTSNGGTGPDAEVFVYDTMTEGVGSRHWIALPGHKRILSLCAGPDGYVYGGTGNEQGDGIPDATLFRFNPADPGPPLDLHPPVPAGTRGIFSVTTAKNGKVYFGTGDLRSGGTWQAARLFEYDPATGFFTDRGGLGTSCGRLSVLVAGDDGLVYGGTGICPGQTGGSAHFMRFNPSTGSLYLSIPSQFGTERSVNAAALFGQTQLFFGTGPAGRLVSYDTSTKVFQNVDSWPYAGQAPVRCLTATGTVVFGCAGASGELFKFMPGSGFTEIGPITAGAANATAATLDNLGKPYFGTTGDQRLVRYDPNYRFTWDKVNFTRSESRPTTAAYVDLRNEADTADLLVDAPSGQSIAGITETAIRLKARLETSDATLTPSVDDWEVTWRRLPGLDQIAGSRSAGSYRGDQVQIWGSNLGGSAGTVSIGGANASVAAWLDNFILATVPQEAVNGDVVVTDSNGNQTPPKSFNLLENPRVDAIVPSSAGWGDVVEIHGSWFLGGREADDWVDFNGTAAEVYPGWTNELIRVQVPANAYSGNVQVSVNGHLSNTLAFTVEPGAAPAVSITRPAAGSTVNGEITVEADVDRTGGTDPVELWADGVLVDTCASSPYSFTWNSPQASDGPHEVRVKAEDGFGTTGEDAITIYTNRTVPEAGDHWYFAEGCTNYGFKTWLLIQNPEASGTSALVRLMDDAGNTTGRTFDLPPNSRTTVNAADILPGSSFSIEVIANQAVVCERAMYWGSYTEGHGSIGATSLSQSWYFAEGCSDFGFETYILLGNPGDAPVSATLNYMYPNGGGFTTTHNIGAHSRLTVDAIREVGAKEFSIRVDAGAPGLVAERSVYRGGKRCGTGTIGCRAPSRTWFLAEGSTNWGFDTWLLIQRPEAGDAQVTAKYRNSEGETIEKVYTVEGESRYTINLSKEIGNADVSTMISSDRPVICERSMYWRNYSAGHCTFGSPSPATVWHLAEGCTDHGFQTYILLDNPSSQPVKATLAFVTSDGSVSTIERDLPPESRTTIDASTHVPSSSFSTIITAPAPIMAERAMYWNNKTGGTASVGVR